jgi:cyanuric acid amidohydrolase
MTRRTQVFVYDMAHPEDCSGLAGDLASGHLQGDRIRAVFIKTEGNGLDNDWSRPLAIRSLAAYLPAGSQAMCVVSGGCEGMLTPHMVVFSSVDEAAPEQASGYRGECDASGKQEETSGAALAIGTAVSASLDAAGIGHEAHVLRTRDAVKQACHDAGLDIADVTYVHVLSPWMSAELAASAPPGAELVARTAHASKPAIRAAAALGAGLALNEIGLADIDYTDAGPTARLHARRVAVTAGDTGGRIHVLVLGNSPTWQGTLGVASTQMSDMLDLQALATARHAHLVAGFFKGDPPPDGRIRGARTTMNSDSDIHAFRHFRAAMSGVFGAALGSPRIFIGGGAEYQCVPGGGLLATIFDLDPDHNPDNHPLR